MWVSIATGHGASCPGGRQCRARPAPSQSEQRKRVHSGHWDPRISRVGPRVLHDTEARQGDLGYSSAGCGHHEGHPSVPGSDSPPWGRPTGHMGNEAQQELAAHPGTQ